MKSDQLYTKLYKGTWMIGMGRVFFFENEDLTYIIIASHDNCILTLKKNYLLILFDKDVNIFKNAKSFLH